MTTDPSLITLPARKAAEQARRIRAAEAMVARMRAYADREGGGFWVFGSFVTGRMSHDSDLDIMIDFPPAGRRAAWEFLEDLSAEHGLAVDVFERATTKPAFVARVEADGLRLP
ncbi:nucleotidyltransferase family protein [Methylobacterium sp. NFXW15]|uniref:nucleotidyltransferase family protein n=1 Tax=Methylobacterium sp. NFXW15 TaxID=2819512 RepID=UPI003CEA0A38